MTGRKNALIELDTGDATGSGTMRILCPQCQQPIRIPEQDAGRSTVCPLCNASFQAPALLPTSPLATAAPPVVSRPQAIWMNPPANLLTPPSPPLPPTVLSATGAGTNPAVPMPTPSTDQRIAERPLGNNGMPLTSPPPIVVTPISESTAPPVVPPLGHPAATAPPPLGISPPPGMPPAVVPPPLGMSPVSPVPPAVVSPPVVASPMLIPPAFSVGNPPKVEPTSPVTPTSPTAPTSPVAPTSPFAPTSPITLTSPTSQQPSANGTATPTEATIPATTWAGYSHFWSLELPTQTLIWGPTACLTLALLLTFFSWVGVYPAGYAAYTQNGWQALFGMVSVDPVAEKTLGLRSMLQEKVRWSWPMLPYLLFLMGATIVAWAVQLLPRLQGGVPPFLAAIWPYRLGILVTFAVLAMLMLVIQLGVGLGLENAISSDLDQKFVEERSKATTPEEIQRVEMLYAQQHGAYQLRKTNYLRLALGSHLLALVLIGLSFALSQRQNQPPPKVGILW